MTLVINKHKEIMAHSPSGEPSGGGVANYTSTQPQGESHPTREHPTQAALCEGQTLAKVRVVVTFWGVVAGWGTMEGLGGVPLCLNLGRGQKDMFPLCKFTNVYT